MRDGYWRPSESAGPARSAPSLPARSRLHRAPVNECEVLRWNKKPALCHPARQRKSCRCRPLRHTRFRPCPRPGPRCTSSLDRRRPRIGRRASLCKLFRRATCRRIDSQRHRERAPGPPVRRIRTRLSICRWRQFGALSRSNRPPRRDSPSNRPEFGGDRRGWRRQIRRTAGLETFCRHCAALRLSLSPCQILQMWFDATSEYARQEPESQRRARLRREISTCQGEQGRRF